MEPKVIFEDSEILVLDKPAGVVVNRSDTTKGEKTVQEWVEGHLKIKVSKERKVSKVSNGKKIPSDTFDTSKPFDTFCQRVGIVHRLDKETSGILLVAKTSDAFENLQKQFKERKVKKTYLALVHGKVEPREGEINVPVGRLPWNRRRFGVLAGGRNAVTRYRAISNSQEAITLLELYPKTGRTHQIRVHLKYFKHPIFSDPLYAGRKTARNDRKLLPRIFLHASKISFYHPEKGDLVLFESPLPEQLKHFLETLNS